VHVIDWHAAAYGAAAVVFGRAARRRRKRRMVRPMRAAQSAARLAAALGDTPAAPSRAEAWRPIIAVRPSVTPDPARPDRIQRWTVRL
jgi:hypothetical protein